MRNRLRIVFTITVLMTAMARLEAATFPIKYRLEKTGQVSVSVYDEKGSLVRELQRALPQTAGEHVLFWDGLDREGNGVPAGNYTWKLLQTPGLSAEFLVQVGANYPIGTNLSSSGGPGTHNGAYTVAVDENGIYISANQTENIETCLLKLSPDGKQRLWSQQLPIAAKAAVAWEGARSIAVDREEVFLLGHVAPQRIYISNANTGAGAGRDITVEWDALGPDTKDSEGRAVQDAGNHGATDLDIHQGVLVVAYKAKNSIRWYNPKTGELIDTAEIPAPQGVTVGANGTVYVTTADKVVTLTQANHALTTIAGGLTNSGRIDIEHTSGDLLVVQGGTSQQIVRLSSAGKILKTYGRAGGRQDGLYNPHDFADVTDVCADGRGGFCIAESYTAPRRTAHFDGQGKLLQEWYGGQPWDTHGAFEPGNPQAMWIASAWSQNMRNRFVIRTTIDYAKKTWQVHSTYRYISPTNPLMHDSGNEGSFFHIHQHAGTRYFVIEGTPCIHKIDEKNWKLIPVTAFGSGFQWNDQNGDGLVQEEEKTPYTGNFSASFAVPHIDANFDYYFIESSHRPFQVKRIPVVKWNAQGAPIYGNLPAGEVVAECPPRFNAANHNDARWSTFLYHDTVGGNLYSALNPSTSNWCTSADSFMQQWNSKGQLTWAAGSLGPASAIGLNSYVPTERGLIYHNLRGIAGVAHGCVVAIDVDGGWTTERAQTYVWDQDGLFVGGIMDHPQLDGTPEFMYHCGGEFAHSDLYTLPNGDVYFAGNWESDVRIYKVTGWDNWSRQTGTLTTAAATPGEVGQGLTAEYFDKQAFTIPRTSRVDASINFDWGTTAPPGTDVNAANGYSARWRGTVRPNFGPKYVGYWTRSQPNDSFHDKFVRGARDNGARCEFKFHGTSIKAVGYKTTNCGFANIYLDGEKVVENLDCFSASPVFNATYFEKSGLPQGDHLLVVETVGWLATPRNKGATDTYVYVDKFVVDGNDIDDAGALYTFYTKTDEAAQLWLGSPGRSDQETCVIYDWLPKQALHETAAAPQKLERKDYPIQLNYSKLTGKGKVSLAWSSPLDAKQPVPALALFPITLGRTIPEVIMECAYIGTDTKTQGNWKGVYGKQGYQIIGAGQEYPAQISMSPSGIHYTWWQPKADVRALQQPATADRSVGAWYSITPAGMTYDFKFTDNEWRKLSVYTLDHAPQNLEIRFEILDATGQLLDTRSLSQFSQGTYLSWNVRGHVLLRMTSLKKDQNPIVFGFFFDPAEKIEHPH